MSQYDMLIVYIRGEDNCVADALSRLPPDALPGENATPPHSVWSNNSVNAMLRVTTDASVLETIKRGYDEDAFCLKVRETNVPGFSQINGLLYVGNRLLIPRVGDLRENLFRLAHDCAGHFGSDKCYATLQHAYYWPNMRRDLEKSYIPSCPDCQRNKSQTSKNVGPLHPLPIPDQRGDSVTMDFIEPLPLDEGFDCILSITD